MQTPGRLGLRLVLELCNDFGVLARREQCVSRNLQ